MAHSFSGSCLCKQASFTVKGVCNTFALCHCKRCRKDTGSAHAANLFVEGELQWTGSPRLTSFTLSQTRHQRTFCPTCGSALPTVLSNDVVMVPAGCLDTEVPVAPTAHIFCEDRALWDDTIQDAPRFEKLPPSQPR